MKNCLTCCVLAILFLWGGIPSSALAQDAASVIWNCVPPDSQHVSAVVGNVVGYDMVGTDTFVVRSYTGTPNGPLGQTHMRWWPFAGGAAVSWGNETGENPNRYVQWRVAPASGYSFTADSITVWLLGGGTSNMRANMYSSTDPTFSTKTLLNTDSAMAFGNSGSVTISQRFGFSLGVTVDYPSSLTIRIYPWYTGAASTSKYVYTQLAEIKGTTTAINSVEDIQTGPMTWQLFQNYPNPFNPETQIKFSVGKTEWATLEVFNTLGQRAATLFNGVAEAGRYYTATLNGAHLASGIYIYRLQSGTRTESKKLVLMR